MTPKSRWWEESALAEEHLTRRLPSAVRDKLFVRIAHGVDGSLMVRVFPPPDGILGEPFMCFTMAAEDGVEGRWPDAELAKLLLLV